MKQDRSFEWQKQIITILYKHQKIFANKKAGLTSCYISKTARVFQFLTVIHIY